MIVRQFTFCQLNIFLNPNFIFWLYQFQYNKYFDDSGEYKIYDDYKHIQLAIFNILPAFIALVKFRCKFVFFLKILD